MAMQEKEIKYSLDIQNVTKAFSKKTLQKGGYTTLKSLILNPLKHEKARNNDFIYAIKDLTLQIPKGKSVGLIGRNGAGKSTLLKLISGIYQPTSGKIKVNGKIAALIELGAGFHPDFTGRENIYLGGAMHGMTTKEIDEVYDDIVKFSELEDYMDAPIRTYSSGMFMRLGFSLAIHTSPDVLIVDEVLAVGDASFNAKCKDRLFEIKKKGTTLLLVSHDLSSIKDWCEEALWIEKGVVKARGIPEKVINKYLSYVSARDNAKLREANKRELNKKEASDKRRDKKSDKKDVLDDLLANKKVAMNLLDGNLASTLTSTLDATLDGKTLLEDKEENKIEISDIKCLNKNKKECYAYAVNDSLTIKFDYKINSKIKDVIFEIKIIRRDGLIISESSSKLYQNRVNVNENLKKNIKSNNGANNSSNNGTVCYEIKDLALTPARYVAQIFTRNNNDENHKLKNNTINFLVRPNGVNSGVILLKDEWKFC
ncbi:MAG: ABC transporter ATP-binding protein [Bdellovibrionota bacterium]